MKKEYSTPILTVYGDATALTEGQNIGFHPNVPRPDGSPKVPTFSK
jgi:hypothetical protein